jgi:hypothetical protein
MVTNDNDPTRIAELPMPDAHGHAALLLVESLIHGLIERSIISVGDVMDIIETANSVQVDTAEAAEAAEAADGHGAPMWRAHELLSSIARSLGHEANGSPLPPRPAQ